MTGRGAWVGWLGVLLLAGCGKGGSGDTGTLAGIPVGTPTGTQGGTTGGTPTGTGTTSTPTGTTTVTTGSLQAAVTWTDDGLVPTDTNGDGLPDEGCGDSVQIEIVDPLGRTGWFFGMAEGGPNGWTGEDCFNGYAQFNHCHPVDPSHTLTEVVDCSVMSVVEGQTTLFDAGKDPYLTYLVELPGAGCGVWGFNPAYYAALGCGSL